MIFVGYKSRAAVATAIGLSQIGEFSFVIFLTSEKLGILSPELASVGTATALVTLICTPFLFRFPKPVWRKIGHLIKQNPASFKEDFKDHVVICGYGRMGSWIGKALDQLKIPFVIIDYNYKVVRKARVQGIPVIFGDPSEPEILEHAKIRNAKAVVVAIPDLVTQEEVISYCQSVVPNISIFARAHLDEDVSKLSQMRIKKVIQPEFEASLGVIKEIMRLNNKNKEEIATKIISLRRLHSLQQ
jgi:CPA2 family monovalent cation:H+ antiporter-2